MLQENGHFHNFRAFKVSLGPHWVRFCHLSCRWDSSEIINCLRCCKRTAVALSPRPSMVSWLVTDNLTRVSVSTFPIVTELELHTRLLALSEQPLKASLKLYLNTVILSFLEMKLRVVLKLKPIELCFLINVSLYPSHFNATSYIALSFKAYVNYIMPHFKLQRQLLKHVLYCILSMVYF